MTNTRQGRSVAVQAGRRSRPFAPPSKAASKRLALRRERRRYAVSIRIESSEVENGGQILAKCRVGGFHLTSIVNGYCTGLPEREVAGLQIFGLLYQFFESGREGAGRLDLQVGIDIEGAVEFAGFFQVEV